MTKRYIFDSMIEFTRAAERTETEFIRDYDGEWANGLSHHQAFELAVKGDDSLVPQAEKLIEKIDASVETPHEQWAPSVYGAYPVVPEFLTGLPECMRHRVRVEGESTPINIWVEMTCSGGISAERMKNRGIAVLALLLKLQAIRPVEVKLMSTYSSGDVQIIMGINSKPLSLSEACFGLCNIAFTRRLQYGYACRNGAPQWGASMPQNEQQIRDRTPMIGDDDLVIPGAILWDDLVLTNPVAWVNQQVARFTRREEED